MRSLAPRLPLLLSALLILLFAACSAPAAAPAAPVAEAPAPAEAAASGSDAEMPSVNPADQAPEATSQPAAEGTRTFRLLPEQSVMQYQVEEEFLGQPVPFVTAIGATSVLDGEVTLAFAGNTVAIERGTFTADISTLTSDRPRRDQAIHDRWLESAQYPLATFKADDVQHLPADAALGKDVTFQVAGDMTIRAVTDPITWSMTARVDGDTLAGTATTYFLMRDYGFEPPDIAGMLKVTDGVSVTVDFVAQELQ